MKRCGCFVVNLTAVSYMTVTCSLQHHILLNIEQMAGWSLTCLVDLTAKGVLLMLDC